MKKTFGGPVLFLDRSDINTDEIIPAKYLTEVTKEALKPFMLEDLSLDGFDPKGEKTRAARVIVTRQNFGCGSSREHAPWVFEVNGVHTVIAESYARIFRQNMFNCGMLALELPKADIERLLALAGEGGVVVDVDLHGQSLTARAGVREETFSFALAPFDQALVEAGGWVGFADVRY
jgi:3-isopropylmalate/(R)-2-methylmalate dehydratase small subunit